MNICKIINLSFVGGTPPYFLHLFMKTNYSLRKLRPESQYDDQRPRASALSRKTLTRFRCTDYHLQIHLKFIAFTFLFLHNGTFRDTISVCW